MSRVPFASLVFRGARFDDVALPVDVLVELAVYRDLIVAMAEVLYREQNPLRVRVPKGFSHGLPLVLGAQEKGSTVPLLDRIVPDQLPGLPGPADIYDQGLVELRACFDEVARGVKSTRPEFLPRLIGFGKTLRGNESVVLATAKSREGPIVDERLRRKIARQVGAPEERPIELVGWVRAADREKDTFALRTPDGRRIEVTSPGPLFSRVLDSFQDDLLVRVPGLAQYDSNGKLVGNVRAHDVSLAEDDDAGCAQPIAEQFETLRGLKPGWLDGAGDAYDSARLDEVRVLVEELVRNGSLPTPFIYPAADGAVQAEWSGENLELAVSFSSGADNVRVISTRLDTHEFVEKSFHRRESGEELRLVRFLGEALRGSVA